jgi:transcriptional regulator with XRE-family HTH domain
MRETVEIAPVGKVDTLPVVSGDEPSRESVALPPQVYGRVGLTIHALRKQRQLSRKELAEKAAVGLSYLVKVEGGERRARLDVLERIAQAMGEPLWRLFSDQRMAPDEEKWHGEARRIMEILPRLSTEDLHVILGVAQRLVGRPTD